MIGIKKNFVLWLTGLPCSGKTTISNRLTEIIPEHLDILDGDEIRKLFSWYDFSKEGIIENNRRVARLADLLVKKGRSVCVSLISPYAQCREEARNIIDCSFFEVYLKCSLDECTTRDVKGLYKKAKDGLIKNFIGLDGRYEVPKNPDLIIDTEKTIKDSLNAIILFLKEKKIITENNLKIR